MPALNNTTTFAVMLVTFSGTTGVLTLDSHAWPVTSLAEPPPTEPATPAPPAVPAQTLPPPPARWNGDQLETMLGSVALYPDPLLAQVFAASTFPVEIVLASRWVSEHPDLTGLDEQAWDPSVRAVARIPTVLKLMNENLDWTAQLGQAFQEQRQEVMEAVQRLRSRAVTLGSLTTTPQQQVFVEPSAVRIVPAEPEVVYVPVYNPQYVYTEPVYDYWWPAPLVTFGVGFAVGWWWNLDCDWHHHNVCYSDWWGHHGHHDHHDGGDWHGADGGDFRRGQFANAPEANVAALASRDGAEWQRDGSRATARRVGSFAGGGVSSPRTSQLAGPLQIEPRVSRAMGPEPMNKPAAVVPAPTTTTGEVSAARLASPPARTGRFANSESPVPAPVAAESRTPTRTAAAPTTTSVVVPAPAPTSRTVTTPSSRFSASPSVPSGPQPSARSASRSTDVPSRTGRFSSRSSASQGSSPARQSSSPARSAGPSPSSSPSPAAESSRRSGSFGNSPSGSSRGSGRGRGG
jgi:hypothetical protein